MRVLHSITDHRSPVTGGNEANLNESKPSWTGAEAIVNQLMEIARISALSEMASGIAHELNQPLGAIAAYAQAGERLLNRPEPVVARALEVFRQINSEALAAGDGIRRIRGLFNQSVPVHTRVQMPLVIEELRPVLDIMAQCANVELKLAVSTPSPDISIDKLRIQHVIFALVQNALHACADSDLPPRIEVAVHADRYAVEVSVTDSGHGVPDSARGHIFRPFFTTKARGTGLGLASCRAIVETHDGTIGFAAVPSGGSRFWFRLPIPASSSE